MVRCGCGLVFQDPQPEASALAMSYYHDEEFSRALMNELRSITFENARRKLELLRAVDGVEEGARILDVGASSGAWLEVAAAHGMHPTGVELGEATSAHARERGLDMRTGTLEQAVPELNAERFDLITFWDVLEHLPDPRAELSLACGLLAPGGKVAATFPNVAGLYPRLTYRLLAKRTGIWEYPELPVHLYDFSPDAARRLFERMGYAVQTQNTFAIPFSFYRSTSLSPERTGPGWRGRALRSAFAALHLAAYPIARLKDQGNAQFIVATAGANAVGSQG